MFASKFGIIKIPKKLIRRGTGSAYPTVDLRLLFTLHHKPLTMQEGRALSL
jgi:hypothetical protein